MIAGDQPWKFGGIGPESIKILDDYTVEITPNAPNMRLVEQLTHSSWSIMAPGSKPGKHPIGTGPFKFDNYKQGQYISVVQHSDYWGEKARLQKITFKFVPDRQTRVLSLLSGDVDMIIRVPTESVNDIKRKPGLEILTSKVSSTTYLCCLLNGKRPFDILNNSAVRHAIALAIDRKSVVRNVWDGNADINKTINIPAVLGKYKDLVKGFEYNVAEAKEILDADGWIPGKDGIRQKEDRRLELTLVSGFPSPKDLRPLPEVIQAQLTKIGVKVRVIEAEGGLYESMLKKKQGDLWLERGPQNDAQPPFLIHLLAHSKGIYSRVYGSPFAVGGKFDQLMSNAVSTLSKDNSSRYTAEALHELIDNEAGIIPIAAHSEIWGIKETVRDFIPHRSHVNQRWNKVYLSE
jgi:peptide/nickel transport system substrate-binding protein